METHYLILIFCRRPSLLKQLWLANSLDIILDFVLTFVSVLFQYSGPVFLKCVFPPRDVWPVIYIYMNLD